MWYPAFYSPFTFFCIAFPITIGMYCITPIHPFTVIISNNGKFSFFTPAIVALPAILKGFNKINANAFCPENYKRPRVWFYYY
jgi:hypothetical protein